MNVVCTMKYALVCKMNVVCTMKYALVCQMNVCTIYVKYLVDNSRRCNYDLK